MTDETNDNDEPLTGDSETESVESTASEEANWSNDPESRQRRLEAVLFLSKQTLSSRKLSQLAGLEDGTQARTMVRQLNEHYDNVGRAFQIKQVAGGYRMFSRPQFAKWIRRQEFVPKATRLSGPLMETLAVIAYRQPILKVDLEAIRGVSCGEVLRQLLEKGLIKIAGRSQELGRPYLYGTSQSFLVQFGLNSIDHLPRAAKLQGKGLPDWSPISNNLNPESTAENPDHPAAVEEVANKQAIVENSLADSENNDSISTAESTD